MLFSHVKIDIKFLRESSAGISFHYCGVNARNSHSFGKKQRFTLRKHDFDIFYILIQKKIQIFLVF